MVPMGLPLADALQYAWLMGWGSLRWPRCLRTSYKLLGNCVAKNSHQNSYSSSWISVYRLNQPCNFQLLWDEFRQVNEGRAMLACRLYDPFQDAEWMVQQARQTLCNHTLNKIPDVSPMFVTKDSSNIFQSKPKHLKCLTSCQLSHKTKWHPHDAAQMKMRHQTRRCKAGTQWQIKPWKTRKSSHRRCNTFQLIFINDPHTSLSSMYSSHHRILFDRNHMFTCISPLPTNATREINDTSWILTITQSQSGNV